MSYTEDLLAFDFWKPGVRKISGTSLHRKSGRTSSLQIAEICGERKGAASSFGCPLGKRWGIRS